MVLHMLVDNTLLLDGLLAKHLAMDKLRPATILMKLHPKIPDTQTHALLQSGLPDAFFGQRSRLAPEIKFDYANKCLAQGRATNVTADYTEMVPAASARCSSSYTTCSLRPCHRQGALRCHTKPSVLPHCYRPARGQRGGQRSFTLFETICKFC